MSNLSGRNALMSIARRTVDVDLPGVGTFRLREMSAADRDRFEASAFVEIVDKGDDGKPQVRRTINSVDLRARLVALCMVDENGARLFPDDEVALLSGALPSSVMATLFVAAQKLNGLDGDAVAEAKENFAAAPTDGSSSA